MSLKKDFEKFTVDLNEELITVLKKLNETGKKVLFVSENGKLIGTITDGDIRRYMLKIGKIEGFVRDFYNPDPVTINYRDINKIDIRKIFNDAKVEIIPVINGNRIIKGYLEWSDFVSDKDFEIVEKIEFDIPVIIMAGGKGTRLKPFTDVLPKPLIPLGDKTAMEKIIENFKKFGLKNFYTIVNFKGNIIEAYFNTIKKDYSLKFIWEEEFLGTVGGLKLIEKIIPDQDFFVSNCDIIVKANLKEILDFHLNNKSIFTSITSIHHHKIPYGVVEINRGGTIEKIVEKPEFVFQINTGVYLLNRRALKYIPEGQYFDMPQLIEKLIQNHEKVYAYPVKESDYIDIGQWSEYKKVLDFLHKL
ncbi:MAG: sugar phosphate nucleotidyltransferase [Thermodesulfovibrio sp.]|nr:sugar phosphate nucleotidyltransferase [Thermodesulfovibrio sp.]MDW7998297.1 sugar phosphate nucleotidyltransferase [Thermodesulfovibrio sp.]